MRKFFFFLLLLLLAALVYGLLVVPVSLEPGQIGLVQSDLFGQIGEISEPGKILLAWSRLIPGDTKLHVFPEGSRLTRRRIQALLPPGTLPGQNNTNDFLCELELSIGYRVTLEALPTLVKAGVTNADAFLQRLADRVEPVIRNGLLKEAEAAILEARPPLLSLAAERSLATEALPQANLWLEGFRLPPAEIAIAWTRLPDSEHYLRMRLALAESQVALSDQLKDWYETSARLSRESRLEASRLDGLKNLALLVSEKPRLLEYLAITSLSDKIRLAIIPGSSDRPGEEVLWPKITEYIDKNLGLLSGSDSPTNKASLRGE